MKQTPKGLEVGCWLGERNTLRVELHRQCATEWGKARGGGWVRGTLPQYSYTGNVPLNGERGLYPEVPVFEPEIWCVSFFQYLNTSFISDVLGKNLLLK